jgi:hypothetical protein
MKHNSPIQSLSYLMSNWIEEYTFGQLAWCELSPILWYLNYDSKDKEPP